MEIIHDAKGIHVTSINQVTNNFHNAGLFQKTNVKILSVIGDVIFDFCNIYLTFWELPSFT